MEPVNHRNRSRVQVEADFVPHLKRGGHLSLEKQFVRAVRGLEAGLHAFVECDAQVPIEPLVQHCLRHGILLMDVSRYYAAEPTQRGVVLGYGGLERQEIASIGTQIVAQVHAYTEPGRMTSETRDRHR